MKRQKLGMSRVVEGSSALTSRVSAPHPPSAANFLRTINLQPGSGQRSPIASSSWVALQNTVLMNNQPSAAPSCALSSRVQGSEAVRSRGSIASQSPSCVASGSGAE